CSRRPSRPTGGCRPRSRRIASSWSPRRGARCSRPDAMREPASAPSPVPALLAARRFLPLFVCQFLGALNDNLFKAALSILITFRLASSGGGLDGPTL